MTSRTSRTIQRIFHRASSCPGWSRPISPGWSRRDPEDLSRGMEPSAYPPLLCWDVMFCFLWLHQAVLHFLKHCFHSLLLNSPLGACLAVANRASHCNKKSLPQEQESVSTEGTKNVKMGSTEFPPASDGFDEDLISCLLYGSKLS